MTDKKSSLRNVMTLEEDCKDVWSEKAKQAVERVLSQWDELVKEDDKQAKQDVLSLWNELIQGDDDESQEVSHGNLEDAD